VASWLNSYDASIAYRKVSSSSRSDAQKVQVGEKGRKEETRLPDNFAFSGSFESGYGALQDIARHPQDIAR
jgi:hypothetical protein